MLRVISEYINQGGIKVLLKTVYTGYAAAHTEEKGIK